MRKIFFQGVVTIAVLVGTIHSAQAQATRWVYVGGRWVVIQVAQTEAYNYARPYVIQGAQNAGQWISQQRINPLGDPMYGAGSTTAMYGLRMQQQIVQQRRICTNGRQQWFC